MARPLLADPDFVKKAAEGRALDINTCIACNQACLDHVFKQQRATCLVNPRACYETELVFEPTLVPKRLAVVGGGAAGMSFASYAAERGHLVTLFEAEAELGGQAGAGQGGVPRDPPLLPPAPRSGGCLSAPGYARHGRAAPGLR